VAQDFLLPEIPEVVFYAMLLNDVVKMGVLCGGMIDIMESTLVELPWSTFKEWVWRNREATRKRVRGLAMHLPFPVMTATSNVLGLIATFAMLLSLSSSFFFSRCVLLKFQ